MAQRVSIKEVAKAAGVSTATVSNVFSGKKPVNDDLAAKVRQVASDLGYQVNKAASLLRSGKNSVVSVLVPDLSDPYFTAIVRELENFAQDDGFEIIVGNSNDDVDREAGRLDALLGWQPAGLIVMPCSDAVPTRLHDKDLPPCVLVDRVAQFDVADTVKIDNVHAGAQAAKHLTENGHRQLLVAASNMDYMPIRERAQGAEAEMRRHGGTVDVVELGSDTQTGVKLLSRWLDTHPLPSAVMATTDMTTLAVLSCVSARRIDMPDEISVVGFDDYTWMAARRTGITCIKQPVSKIAHSAWQRLKTRIEGEAGEPVCVMHECELVLRDSVKNTTQKRPEFGLRAISGRPNGVDQFALRRAVRSVIKKGASAKVGG